MEVFDRISRINYVANAPQDDRPNGPVWVLVELVASLGAAKSEIWILWTSLAPPQAREARAKPPICGSRAKWQRSFDNCFWEASASQF